MTEQHPITPPAELVKKWDTEGRHQDYCTVTEYVTAKAAQWGSDQELEACLDWLDRRGSIVIQDELRAARRPEPPSLKEQALKALEALDRSWTMPKDLDAVITIRRALESIND